MSFTSLLGQGNHQESLFGGRQGMPFLRNVLEHDFVLFVIDDHAQSPHFIGAEEWTGIVPSSINQVHVYCFPGQQSSGDGLFNHFVRVIEYAVNKSKATV